MILADKIINLRKKAAMTQEDLASQVGVSRQSVSKWESSMSMPDLDKIMKLSNIFGVSTDFLLNDDLGMEEIIVDQKVENTSRLIDIDILNKYFDTYEKIARYISLATLLVILSPIAFMSLEKINESAGIIVFLALIAIAVGLFINSGFLASKFEYIEKEAYDFSYGVEGVIKKETSQYEPIFKRNLITAVVVFILGPSMYMLFEKLGLDENLGVYIFLALIGLAASLLAYSSIRYSSYKDIIKFRDPKIQKKEGRLGKASGILWILTIGIYLAYSLKTGNWDKSWIIFVISSFIQVAIAIFFD